MKILVTGGAGFIGSWIVQLLIARGDSVVIVDDFSSGRRENCPAGAVVEEISICDPGLSDVVARHRPDAAVHTAAQVSVAVSVREAARDAEINILGSINLFESCVHHGVKKVVYSASGGTYYGEVPGELPTESTPPHPESPYGISKLAVEHYLNFYRLQHGLHSVSLRYGNVYGPRQDPHGEAGVVAIFCKKMLNGVRSTIFGDGGCVRDYIYAEDVARANLASIDGPDYGAYNIGTGQGTDVNALYGALAEAMHFKEPAEYGPPRPGDLQRSVLNAGLAGRELNWRAEFGLREGLEATCQFFRENPEW